MSYTDQEMKDRIARFRAGESAVERKTLRANMATLFFAASIVGMLSRGCTLFNEEEAAKLACTAADALLAELEKPQ